MLSSVDGPCTARVNLDHDAFEYTVTFQRMMLRRKAGRGMSAFGGDHKVANRPKANFRRVRFWEWGLGAKRGGKSMSASGGRHISKGCLARPSERDSLAVTLETRVSWDQQRTYCENRGLARIDVDA